MLSALALRLLVAAQAARAELQDEDGQTLAEYGMILAVVAVTVIVAAGIAFRDVIVDTFNNAVDCLDGSC